jgi:hypothetical protein
VLAYVVGICRRRGVEVVNGREAVLFAMSKTYRDQGKWLKLT